MNREPWVTSEPKQRSEQKVVSAVQTVSTKGKIAFMSKGRASQAFQPSDRIIRRVKAMRAENHTTEEIAKSIGAPIKWVRDQVRDTPLVALSSLDKLEDSRRRYAIKKSKSLAQDLAGRTRTD